jgi:hypothetical protein
MSIWTCPRNPLRMPVPRQACGCREPCHVMREHVLVYEAAEPASSQRPNGALGSWRGVACGRALMQRSVRSVRVVMLGELA